MDPISSSSNLNVETNKIGSASAEKNTANLKKSENIIVKVILVWNKIRPYLYATAAVVGFAAVIIGKIALAPETMLIGAVVTMVAIIALAMNYLINSKKNAVHRHSCQNVEITEEDRKNAKPAGTYATPEGQKIDYVPLTTEQRNNAKPVTLPGEE